MAQLVKCLACNLKEVSLDVQHVHESHGEAVGIYNPSTGKAETERSLPFHKSLSLESSG